MHTNMDTSNISTKFTRQKKRSPLISCHTTLGRKVLGHVKKTSKISQGHGEYVSTASSQCRVLTFTRMRRCLPNCNNCWLLCWACHPHAHHIGTVEKVHPTMLSTGSWPRVSSGKPGRKGLNRKKHILTWSTIDATFSRSCAFFSTDETDAVPARHVCLSRYQPSLVSEGSIEQ
jgi:hypothetical protein